MGLCQYVCVIIFTLSPARVIFGRTHMDVRKFRYDPLWTQNPELEEISLWPKPFFLFRKGYFTSDYLFLDWLHLLCLVQEQQQVSQDGHEELVAFLLISCLA